MNMENNVKLSDSEIIKSVHGMQKKRKILGVIDTISTLWIVLGILVVFFLFSLHHMILGVVAGVTVIICIPVSVVLSKKTKKIDKEIKIFIGENIIKEVIAEKISIEEYDPDGCINSKYVRKSGIVPNFYDKIHGSDYIKGDYKGIKIVYCDIELEYEKEYENSKGHKSTTMVTVFKGPFLSLHLPKKIEGYVKICERQNPKKKKGFVTELLSNALYSAGIKLGPEEIEVESVEFNNQFEVTTNNKELAFYILTPHFMENIIKADELANGYTNIKFDDDRAKIAINNGHDAFEITKTIFNENRLEEARQNMRNDLNVLLAIIDEILEKERLFES